MYCASDAQRGSRAASGPFSLVECMRSLTRLRSGAALAVTLLVLAACGEATDVPTTLEPAEMRGVDESRARVFLGWAGQDMSLGHFRAAYGRAQTAMDIFGPDSETGAEGRAIQKAALDAGVATFPASARVDKLSAIRRPSAARNRSSGVDVADALPARWRATKASLTIATRGASATSRASNTRPASSGRSTASK